MSTTTTTTMENAEKAYPCDTGDKHYALKNRKEIATYRLAPNVYLREFSYDRFVLQKGSHTVRLFKGELKQIQDISDPVMVCMEDFKEGKQIKFTQNLGKEVFLSVQTPYRCIDIRKFWVIPDTEQLHATNIGVPLTFSEFKRLLDEEDFFTGRGRGRVL